MSRRYTDFLNQKLGGQSTVLFASRGIPISQEERSGRKRDREILWGGRRGGGNFVAACNRWSAAMPQPNDLSRSLVALDQNSTIIAVVEMSQSSWLVWRYPSRH